MWSNMNYMIYPWLSPEQSQEILLRVTDYVNDRLTPLQRDIIYHVTQFWSDIIVYVTQLHSDVICSCHPASAWWHPTSEWLRDHEWISPSLGAMLDHNTMKLGDILIMLLWRRVTWSITANWNKCDIIDHITHWINVFMQSSLLLWGPFFFLSALIFSCQWVRHWQN